MGQLSARQSQAEARIALFKEPDSEQEPIRSTSHLSSVVTESNPARYSKDRIIIHYTHEDRFATTKREMHIIFREAFANFGIEAVRLIVGHRNSPNLQRELIRKRPPMRLLHRTKKSVCQIETRSSSSNLTSTINYLKH